MSDRRERILAAARELFSGNGYKTTSIQQIADTCKISKGAFYLHFRSKDQLLLALIERMEEESFARIENLRRDTNLDPREKLRRQIKLQIEDIVDNRDLSQIFLQETGLSLSEELVLFIRKCRFTWQKTQEAFLLEAYGPGLEKYLIDAAIALNGVLNEYYTILILEGVEIDINQLADYLLHLTDHITTGLTNTDVPPMFTAEIMPSRRELEQQALDGLLKRARTAFEELRERTTALDSGGHQREELFTTLEIIDAELQKEEPNKILIQGVLANLRGVSDLAESRAKLARSLEIKLL